jgi:hypothetical protein
LFEVIHPHFPVKVPNVNRILFHHSLLLYAKNDKTLPIAGELFSKKIIFEQKSPQNTLLGTTKNLAAK